MGPFELCQACGKSKKYEKALELLAEMRKHGLEPNIITYNAAISACENCKQDEKALELMADMRQHKLMPNIITYNAVISSCEKGQKYEKALELVAELRLHGLEPSIITYNAAITACEKGQKYEKALELLVELKHDGLPTNVRAYSFYFVYGTIEKSSEFDFCHIWPLEASRGVQNTVTGCGIILPTREGTFWKNKSLSFLTPFELCQA